MQGRVRCFYEEREFGFIEYNEKGAGPGIFDRSVFFSLAGVLESTPLRSGDYVDFEIETDQENRLRATNVQLTTDTTCQLAQTRRGEIKKIPSGKDFGFISYKQQFLFFHFSEVQPADDGLLYQPVVGCLVKFEIAKRHNKLAAIKVRILEWPEVTAPTFEENFAAAEELPLDVPEYTVPIPKLAEPSVLATATSKLTLKEIVLQRKLKKLAVCFKEAKDESSGFKRNYF